MPSARRHWYCSYIRAWFWRDINQWTGAWARTGRWFMGGIVVFFVTNIFTESLKRSYDLNGCSSFTTRTCRLLCASIGSDGRVWLQMFSFSPSSSMCVIEVWSYTKPHRPKPRSHAQLLPFASQTMYRPVGTMCRTTRSEVVAILLGIKWWYVNITRIGGLRITINTRMITRRYRLHSTRHMTGILVEKSVFKTKVKKFPIVFWIKF